MTAPRDQTVRRFESCVVLMLGHPGVGKRTVGGALAARLDGGVLVDNALVNRPVLEVLDWDGVAPLPEGTWDLVAPIRATVLQTIEQLAPPSLSYVFTNVLEDDAQGAAEYSTLRGLAERRGSLFLAVLLSCEIDTQVSRIDNPDRIALRKGSDPEGYRGYTLATPLYRPPASETVRLDTTETPAADNAQSILDALEARGLERSEKGSRHLHR